MSVKKGTYYIPWYVTFPFFLQYSYTYIPTHTCTLARIQTHTSYHYCQNTHRTIASRQPHSTYTYMHVSTPNRQVAWYKRAYLLISSLLLPPPVVRTVLWGYFMLLVIRVLGKTSFKYYRRYLVVYYYCCVGCCTAVLVMIVVPGIYVLLSRIPGRIIRGTWYTRIYIRTSSSSVTKYFKIADFL